MFSGRRKVPGGGPAPLLINTEQSTCQVLSIVYILTSTVSLICLIIPIFFTFSCSDHYALMFIQVVLLLNFICIFVFMYLGVIHNGSERQYLKLIGIGVIILIIQCGIMAFGLYVSIALILAIKSQNIKCTTETELYLSISLLNLLHATTTTLAALKLLFKLFQSLVNQYKTYESVA
ncbi:hypothetical protein ACR3K2_36290 [Cryptosporidium serpentis]